MTASLESLGINLSKLTCEWEDCGETFDDRFDFLRHITRAHINAFDGGDDTKRCKWDGCECGTFAEREHFQLHMSVHAYHHQIMHLGYQIMSSKKPDLCCYMDPSTRNVIADFPNVLLCGWKDCGGEFFDYELFLLHVDTHAMEDVIIPVMSKEKLKKLKFARCEWVNCGAAFNTKSHLKMHLMAHSQKKFVACPICGAAFCKREGFLNHCYRQETPTSIENFQICTYEEDDDDDDANDEELNDGDNRDELDEDEPEGILTIDEDANPSSIVIHLPQNLQKIIPSHSAMIDRRRSSADQTINLATQSTSSANDSASQSMISSSSLQSQHGGDDDGHSNVDSSTPSSGTQILHLPNQNVALLVNLNLTSSSSSSSSSSNTNKLDSFGDISLQHSLTAEQRSSTTTTTTTTTTATTTTAAAAATASNNLIQLSLASAESSQVIENDMMIDEDREFRCHLCTKSYSTRSLLHEHLTKHVRKHVCPHCEYAATYPARLREHILYRHSDRREFECKFCEQTFKTKYTLMRHVALHNANGEDDERNSCKLCDKKFSSYYTLTQHVRLAHIGELIIFACHLCKREYNRGNNLSRHLKNAHRLETSSGGEQSQRFVYEKQADGIFRLKQN